jgi:hypothetical protein
MSDRYVRSGIDVNDVQQRGGAIGGGAPCLAVHNEQL